MLAKRVSFVIGLTFAAWQPLLQAAEPVCLVPQVKGVTIDASDADWADGGYRADALADIRVGHRPNLTSSPRVRLGWDEAGLVIFLRSEDNTPTDPATADGDRVEVLIADARTRPGTDGKGFQLAVTPVRALPAAAPAVTWTDKRADTAAPLTVEAASSGWPGGYVVEMRLPWSDFAGFGKPGGDVCVQVYVHDAATGLDRVTFGLKPTTESRWLGPDQMTLIRFADQPSPPASLAVYAEYQRYRRTQVRITDTAADGETGYVIADAAGRTIGEASTHGRAGESSRATVNLPMPPNMPADRTISVTRVARAGHPAENASVVPAGPLGREDMLATAEFRFETTVFSSAAFPASDFADPLAIEDMIGPYTVVRRFFDADFNEVTSADKPGRYGALVTFLGQNGLKGQREVTLYRAPKSFRWRTQAVGGTDVTLPADLGVPPNA
ncbi:MAG: hypothetical protein JWM57_1064, partial [Phycisphaerales bacterium]|nr:hypothetical protein [Phycisphaerales bacterium]